MSSFIDDGASTLAPSYEERAATPEHERAKAFSDTNSSDVALIRNIRAKSCHYDFFTSESLGTMCIMDQRLTDPQLLAKVVMLCHDNSTLKPHILIDGTHTYEKHDGESAETVTQTDFHFYMALELLDLPKQARTKGRESVHYEIRGKKVVSEERPSLEQWCDEFCSSTAWSRLLRARPTIAGLNERYLQNEICAQLRAAGYRGKVTVTFPLTAKKIDFYYPTALARFRQTLWWAVLKLFIWWSPLWLAFMLYIYFWTQYWEVVDVEWQVGMRIKTESCSEHAWLRQYSRLIRDLAKSKFTGDAEPWLRYGYIETPDILPPERAQMTQSFEAVPMDKKDNSGWGWNGICVESTYDPS